MALGSVSEQYGRLSLREAGHRRISRRLVAGCLIAPLALLVVLAYADPPDPPWIPGIYDNGDYDDVVALITDGIGVSNSHAMWRYECVAKVIPRYVVTERVPLATTHAQIIRGPPPRARAPFSIPVGSNLSRGFLIGLATMTFSPRPPPSPLTGHHSGHHLTSGLRGATPRTHDPARGLDLRCLGAVIADRYPADAVGARFVPEHCHRASSLAQEDGCADA